MTALLSLNNTQQSLAKFENQVSTGLKIGSAADNASYWSIATSMTSQVGALGAVSNALSESGSMLATMSAALQSTVSIMDNIKNDLITAGADTGDASALQKVQTDIQTQQQALISMGTSAIFNNQNLLAAATGTSVNMVASYDATNGLSYITLNTSNTALFGTGVSAGSTANLEVTSGGILDTKGANFTGASVLSLDVTASGLTSGDISNMLKDVETALSSIESAASTIGATQTNITEQQNFVSALSDSLTSGVGSLVDADMNQASTRISALQVQQQLGVQALSIANSNTQLILRLFQ
ncbi:MAG: flagellin [Beijerinckiaceae bacterium]|nr:MAG: flagellin [Beijerinckiaceae bacterium]